MNTAVVESLEGLHWNANGFASLSGALLDYAHRLDGVIRGWARDLGGTDYVFPAMLAAGDLAPIAYLRSFPHLATFVTSIDRNDESLRGFAARQGTATQIAAAGERFDAVEYLLTPAACYHFYPRFANRDLPAPVVLSTRCQCHRREDHYLPLQRQWCFEMREIVCIGDRATVETFADNLQARAGNLHDALGIRAAWQPATDPFFDPDADPKALAQRLEPTKLELCTNQGLAIASVNRHRSFFGERYRISCQEVPAYSACVAFGIERWLYALFEAHGTDVSHWPGLEVASCP
jgi:hypothetical protein